ncbi:MAG: four helix bundle protein [Candidatus Omnitrophica bacterium]|nr:four helix bundle protein [Candidatus Omnitrophota bacterium]
MAIEKKFDIYDRALKFAIKTAKIIENLPNNIVFREYSKQLIRSSGSIGANIEEADGTLTRKDFINKLGIARRESRESAHWLRLIENIFSGNNPKLKEEIQKQIKEAKELMLILSSIINKIKDK